jgi:uncharacterized protein (DUF1330 family)
MTAFFIATTTVKDMEKFQDYAGKAAQTFAPFGGELVIRGTADQTLAGASNHQAVSVVRFPDMEALEAWYRSPDYQALIPLRDDAAQMTLTTYQEPA